MKKNKKIFLLIITTFAFLTFLNSGLTIKLENSVYRLSVKLVSILNAQQCLCDECNCNVNVDIPVPLPVIIDNTPLPVSLQEINPGLLPLSVAEAPSSPIFQYYYQLVNRDLSKFRFSQYVQEAVLFYLTSAKTSCEYFMKVIDVTVKDQRICRNVVENWGNFLEDIPKNVRLETARQLDTAAGLDSDLKEELINSNTHFPYNEIIGRYKHFHSRGMIKDFQIDQEFLNHEMFDYNLQMIDKLTLRNGIERRLPFTDYELLRFKNYKTYRKEAEMFLNSK